MLRLRWDTQLLVRSSEFQVGDVLVRAGTTRVVPGMVVSIGGRQIAREIGGPQSARSGILHHWHIKYDLQDRIIVVSERINDTHVKCRISCECEAMLSAPLCLLCEPASQVLGAIALRICKPRQEYRYD